MLHDYLEDIEGARPADVEAHFGANVLRLVEALSDTTAFPKPPWRPRKEAFIERMRVAGPDVRLICCADKHHNAQSIVRGLSREGLAVFDRFSGGLDGTLWSTERSRMRCRTDGCTGSWMKPTPPWP